MSYIYSTASNYIESTTSYINSTITYYTQTTPQLTPVEELGQSIEKTFSNTYTSKEGKATASELAVLADIITMVRRRDEIGLQEQIENARSMDLQEQEKTLGQLSRSATFGIFREKQEVAGEARASVFSKLSAFIEQNRSLITAAESLNQNQEAYLLSRKELSKEVAKVIDELMRVAREFTLTTPLHIMPPIDTSISTSSISSGSEMENKGDVSVWKVADNLQSLVIDGYVPTQNILDVADQV